MFLVELPLPLFIGFLLPQLEALLLLLLVDFLPLLVLLLVELLDFLLMLLFELRVNRVNSGAGIRIAAGICRAR